MKELVTRAEAAKRLGVSKVMVDVYREKGQLHAVPTEEGRVYFEKDQVEALKKVREERLREKERKVQRRAEQAAKVLERLAKAQAAAELEGSELKIQES